MNYIIFDLEFNQDFYSTPDSNQQEISNTNNSMEPQAASTVIHCPSEIIQIGAMKLDANFETIASFNRFVKPTLYPKVSPFITNLTGITTAQLQPEELFPIVYEAFSEFIGKEEAIFCVWGSNDVKELFRNATYHQLSLKPLPRAYINIQPYVSLHFGLPIKKPLRLQYSVEALGLPVTTAFHDALSDATYTAAIFKKLYQPSILPMIYDPSPVVINRPRQVKKVIDFEALLQQFEKMYHREMTDEERGIIKLAYQMGKTNQFVKIPE
ncbi:MAG TPA: 3'-5' exonuclease [Mobilitalea sp.]|nr:3'-5' exonuclease [Mobilitalea sp.]